METNKRKKSHILEVRHGLLPTHLKVENLTSENYLSGDVYDYLTDCTINISRGRNIEVKRIR